MKTAIILFFMLLSLSLYSSDYNFGVGLRGAIPILTTEATAMCGCSGEIDYNWQVGAIFSNELKLSKSFSIMGDIQLNYSKPHISSKNSMSEDISGDFDKTFSQFSIAFNPAIKFFLIDKFFLRFGLKLSFHLNKPDEVEDLSFLGLTAGVGYSFYDSLTIELKVEFPDRFNIGVKDNIYTSPSLSVLYYF